MSTLKTNFTRNAPVNFMITLSGSKAHIVYPSRDTFEEQQRDPEYPLCYHPYDGVSWRWGKSYQNQPSGVPTCKNCLRLFHQEQKSRQELLELGIILDQEDDDGDRSCWA